MSASIIRKRVHLTGTHRDGSPIEHCNGDFMETFLLMPGIGVYFLVSRDRVPIDSPALRPEPPK